MATREEEELARKKSIRAAPRSSTTRLLNQADTLLGAEPPDTDELELIQTNITAKMEILGGLNVDIVGLTPDDQLDNEVERADEYSEKMQRCLMWIRKALMSQSPVPTVRPSDSRDSNAPCD